MTEVAEKFNQEVTDYLKSGVSLVHVFYQGNEGEVIDIIKNSMPNKSGNQRTARTYGYYEWDKDNGLMCMDAKSEEMFGLEKTSDINWVFKFFLSPKTPWNKRHDFDCWVVVLKGTEYLEDTTAIRWIKEIDIHNDDENNLIRKQIHMLHKISDGKDFEKEKIVKMQNIPIEIRETSLIIDMQLSNSKV